MSVLVLIRHGQSQWNLENRFTGWTDVPLTERGRADAALCGQHLTDLHFEKAFCARLERAIDTLKIILKEIHQEKISIVYDSGLNERHYGDLQGLNKAETAAKYGQEKVHLWRRSYTTRPPNGESLEDCGIRSLRFFQNYILPKVESGKNILVIASGNSFRPIMKYLGNLDDETAATMEVGLCTPYIYTFKGRDLVKHEVREIPGIVTKGASQTETKVEEGRV